MLLPDDLGKVKKGPKFTQIFSKSAAVNRLSAARFFLFGARDVWFVVGLPVFLSDALGWNVMQVGGFLALWVIGYGIVQASVPSLLRRTSSNAPDGRTLAMWAFALCLLPAAMALMLRHGWPAEAVVMAGLAGFAVVFAINSAAHSFLIVAWSEREHVSMNVGFYYMANAGGRLAGTVLSGLIYQTQGMAGCLAWSAAFVLAAGLISLNLPRSAKGA